MTLLAPISTLNFTPTLFGRRQGEGKPSEQKILDSKYDSIPITKL
jgi:hypothetical protein